MDTSTRDKVDQIFSLMMPKKKAHTKENQEYKDAFIASLNRKKFRKALKIIK